MTDFNPLGEPAPEGGQVQMVWTRTSDDVATNTYHFVHANRDVVGDTLPFVADDAAAIEARLETLWDSLKGMYTADMVLDRFVWHHFGVDIAKPNPNWRTTSIGGGTPGTSSGDPLPPDTAISVTFKTDHRRSWGRVYLPAPVQDVINDGGLIQDATCDAIRTAFGTLLDGATADGLPLVVWCPRHAGKLLQYSKDAEAAGLNVPDTSSVARGVTQVQVDNVWDSIRRRRTKRATHKATHTLGG